MFGLFTVEADAVVMETDADMKADETNVSFSNQKPGVGQFDREVFPISVRFDGMVWSYLVSDCNGRWSGLCRLHRLEIAWLVYSFLRSLTVSAQLFLMSNPEFFSRLKVMM